MSVNGQNKNNQASGNGGKKVSQEDLMKMWEKTVDVQMHFNDLQLRIRNFAILIVSAFVGGFGVALKENYLVEIHGAAIPVASLLFFVAALIWLAFYLMDTLWYHPLLMGAVEHGRLLEEKMREQTGLPGLTETIKLKSPTKVLGFEVHSKHKAKWFYFSIFAFLIIMATLLYWAKAGAIQSEKNSQVVEGQSVAKSNAIAATRTGATQVKPVPQAKSN
ncbi:hypothetical protein [Burkholderia glumae]|uniref:hypothetical protein n=6 Tax=Burkholderia TaxID=32008 RepID=UPI002037312A|nr:hypothetical protein [Burkholderia glumae]MCM2480650.1 hypothetical protein [Burkholderia glumae]MCM2509211.1 hypothetical protein [Burkholderia glumae]